MNVKIDRSAPSLEMTGASESEPSGIVDLNSQREIRQLRQRVVELEALQAEASKALGTTLRPAEYASENHGFQCGVHPHITVGNNTPSVWCANCGEELDPIEVLRQYAKHERSFVYENVVIKREKAKLEAEVKDLKRSRDNLRSQIRRAKKKS